MIQVVDFLGLRKCGSVVTENRPNTRAVGWCSFQRGACLRTRDCGHPISGKYPADECKPGEYDSARLPRRWSLPAGWPARGFFRAPTMLARILQAAVGVLVGGAIAPMSYAQRQALHPRISLLEFSPSTWLETNQARLHLDIPSGYGSEESGDRSQNAWGQRRIPKAKMRQRVAGAGVSFSDGAKPIWRSKPFVFNGWRERLRGAKPIFG